MIRVGIKWCANSHIFLFVNHIANFLKWPKKLSELLAVEHIPVFVLEIHDKMDKNEEVTVARLFTDAAHLAEMTSCALVATSTGITGIDQRDLNMVGRAGLAREIISKLWSM